MKILYLDLGMGAAGDMLTAALMELLPDREVFLQQLKAAGISKVSYHAEPSVKCGITGTHMSVKIDDVEEGECEHGHSHDDTDYPENHHHVACAVHECYPESDLDARTVHDHHRDNSAHEPACAVHDHHQGSDLDVHTPHPHEHSHSRLEDIRKIVDGLSVSDKVKADALAVYQLIAEAEGHVHGKPVTEIHFHEVGTMDAIADVVAVCLLMEEIAPEKIVASPVHVGSGQVHCAHGILPVPAPATAYILQGIPTYGGGIRGELCTPTGAALLKYFVAEYGSQPVMTTQAIGYGMGKKDFEAANCVRALLGESENRTDTVYELSCNVDDMTAERIAFAMERFFEAGAKEVFTQSVGMKKSRPGTMIQVLCAEAEREKMVRLIFQHTTTIGIRESVLNRYVLERTVESIDTPWGTVRRKKCTGYGVTRTKYEYEDLAEIARAQNISLEKLTAELEKLN